MRNTFRFLSKTGGQAITVHNELLGLADQLKEGVRYGQYMLLFDASGMLMLAKQTEIVDYNADVVEGELFATYKITVSAKELTSAIAEVGLSAFAEGVPINKCKVSVAPDNLEIFCTVYLELNGIVQLVPGDNEFVKFLLGMTAATFGAIHGAACNLPNVSLVPDTGLYRSVVTDVQKDEGGILWTLQGGAQYNDFLCYVNGKPAFRYNRGVALAEREIQSHYSLGGFVVPAVEVMDVIHSWGNAFGSFINITGLYDSSKREGLFVGYEFFYDPMFRYAGLCNGSRYYLIDAQKLRVYDGGAYSGKLIMCSDGEVVSVDGGLINLLGKDEKIYVPEGQAEVLYREHGYDIFVYADGAVYRFRYEGSLELIDQWHVGEGGTLSRLYDYAVIWMRDDEKRVFSFVGELFISYPGLWAHRAESVLDGCCYGDGYVTNVFTGETVECDKAKGRFFVKEGMLGYIGESGSVLLQPDFEFDDVAIAGYAVMFLYEGVLTFYRPSFDGLFVTVPVEEDVQCLVKKWHSTNVPTRLRLKYSWVQ
ncbi:MAG: hypothetical protein E7350_02245 [Clostridiales bacterium]|nr:hypothetical protein [Clostridiales bacterium]